MATKRGKSYTLNYEDRNGSDRSLTVYDRNGSRTASSLSNEAHQKVRDRGGKPGPGNLRNL